MGGSSLRQNKLTAMHHGHWMVLRSGMYELSYLQHIFIGILIRQAIGDSGWDSAVNATTDNKPCLCN